VADTYMLASFELRYFHFLSSRAEQDRSLANDSAQSRACPELAEGDPAFANSYHRRSQEFSAQPREVLP
jgi:hypothetical protein